MTTTNQDVINTIVRAGKQIKSEKAKVELRLAINILREMEHENAPNRTARKVGGARRVWQPSAKMLAAQAEAKNTGKTVKVAR